MSEEIISLNEATILFNEELRTADRKVLSSIYKFILSKKDESNNAVTKMILEIDNCNDTTKIALPQKKGVNNEIACAILKNSIISVVKTYMLDSDTSSIFDYFVFEFLNNYSKKYKDKRKKLLNFLDVYDILTLEEKVKDFPDFISKMDINIIAERLKKVYLILLELEFYQSKSERKSIFNIITEEILYDSSDEYFENLYYDLYNFYLHESVISYYKIKNYVEKYAKEINNKKIK